MISLKDLEVKINTKVNLYKNINCDLITML